MLRIWIHTIQNIFIRFLSLKNYVHLFQYLRGQVPYPVCTFLQRKHATIILTYHYQIFSQRNNLNWSFNCISETYWTNAKNLKLYSEIELDTCSRYVVSCRILYITVYVKAVNIFILPCHVEHLPSSASSYFGKSMQYC